MLKIVGKYGKTYLLQYRSYLGKIEVGIEDVGLNYTLDILSIIYLEKLSEFNSIR